MFREKKYNNKIKLKKFKTVNYKTNMEQEIKATTTKFPSKKCGAFVLIQPSINK